MNRVDDLIHDIQVHEVVELEEELSSESRKRIEALVLQRVQAKEGPQRKRKPLKKLYIW